MRILSIVLLCVLAPLRLLSQLPETGHWVYFVDKGPEAQHWLLHPDAFLSPAALDRYARHGVAITEADVPVSRTYLAQLRANGFQIAFASRWLNAAYVRPTTPDALAALGHPPHVRRVVRGRTVQVSTTEMPSPVPPTAASSTGTAAINYGLSAGQNNMLNLACLHNLGYRGQGTRVAFFDSGFPKLDIHAPFDSMFNENRLLGTHDFYTGNPVDFSSGDGHGSWCFSITGANQDGVLVGAAPWASFFLLRTENVAYERNVEEQNWLAAAEWADSAGADIISSSLSYNDFDAGQTDYQFSDMDGQTTICAQAAQFAAARGILVVNSAGNEGGNSWGRITTPCDADSILCVGAVNSNEVYATFSSRGYSADGRVKPDVTAQGQATAYFNVSSGLAATGNGTSFSAPLITGLAACLLTAHPTATAWEIRRSIMLSADRQNTPDSLYGHGVPDACGADSVLAIFTTRPEGQPAECPELRIAHRALSGYWDLTLFSPNSHTYTLEVVDMTGRTVHRQENLWANVRYPISTDGLGNGVYFIRARWPQAHCQLKLLLVR